MKGPKRAVDSPDQRATRHLTPTRLLLGVSVREMIESTLCMCLSRASSLSHAHAFSLSFSFARSLTRSLTLTLSHLLLPTRVSVWLGFASILVCPFPARGARLFKTGRMLQQQEWVCERLPGHGLGAAGKSPQHHVQLLVACVPGWERNCKAVGGHDRRWVQLVAVCTEHRARVHARSCLCPPSPCACLGS